MRPDRAVLSSSAALETYDEQENYVSVSTSPDAPSYSFDNDDREAVDRHNYLGEILDELTVSRLAGIGDLTGKRFLEIGAGGGGVARWMADQAGPTGRVLATDINPRHIPPYPGVSVLRHDLTTEKIPDGPWDVIHGRLVLLHLPEREEILIRLAEALAPGGSLVLEEWETTFRKLVLAAPDAESAALFDLYHELLVERILPAKGNSPSWASRVHSAMLDAGLTDVDTVVTSSSWTGGTAGALIIAANIAQLREEFLAVGMTATQLEQVARLVNDPRIVLRSHFTYSTVGRRPLE
jgi:2-polyprenyl-3-methyl-5-hydroxy-6-metoxy-1,4-benzoquinol methylase